MSALANTQEDYSPQCEVQESRNR